MDGKESVILTVSKMSVIEDIRKMIKEKLNVEPQCQRLFFRGKQVRSRFSPFLCVMMMIVLDFDRRWRILTGSLITGSMSMMWCS